MYPLGVNSVYHSSGKFPVIFDISSELHYKGLSDELVSEGHLKVPLNVNSLGNTIEWGSLEDKIHTTYTKIENDIPYRKIPTEKIVKLSTNKTWRAFNEHELRVLHKTEPEESFFPIIDVVSIPDKVGKYWIKVLDKKSGKIASKYSQPNYDVVTTNGGYKELRITLLPHLENPNGTFEVPTTTQWHIEVYNKLPPLELPITIQFTKRVREFWFYKLLQFHPKYSTGNTSKPYTKWGILYHEVTHEITHGNRPFFFNIGTYRTHEDYITGAFKNKPRNVNIVDWISDIDVINNHNNPLIEQGLVFEFSDQNDWQSNTNAQIQEKLKKKFIYEFCYPREYGLKGIRFHDIVHEYKIDSFSKPTGNGNVIYDRFRVKLAYPLTSKIEITTEPTSWVLNRTKFRLRSKPGWLNSGSDQWGQSPVAEGADIIGQLPPGMDFVVAYRELSKNISSDKWIGYYFLFRNPFGNRIGLRMSQKPTTTLLNENVDDPNFKIQVDYNDFFGDEKYPLIGILIKDYNPSAVARASTHRNASNRWSIYLHPIEFEMEVYLK